MKGVVAPVKKDLAGKQLEVLEFLKSELCNKGYPHRYGDLRSGRFEIHLHGAWALGKTGEKGLIRRDPSKPRAIEILDSSPLSIAGTWWRFLL